MALSNSPLEDSPGRGCAPVAALERYIFFLTIWLYPFTVYIALLNISLVLCGDRDLDFLRDCPHESTKFSGDSGYNDLFNFTFGP